MGHFIPPADDSPRTSSADSPPESVGGSVTRWLGGLKAGDPHAFDALWRRYFDQLARMIRARLCASPQRSPVKDEEDVALSVLNALHEGVRAGRFPQLDDRDNLWLVLAHLVKCKLIDMRRKLNASKNPDLRTLREADLIANASSSGGEPGNPLDRLLAEGPSPGMAAEMAEQLRLRLDALTKPDARRIAELKLMGYTNEEVAAEVGCSLRKVTMRLNYVRKTWEGGADDDPTHHANENT